ncbi:unnamed protein product [Adineta ricciae]|uniref:3CxxC-type domain-containing protein n=1 Tax=Adineta ricciae TaxID=249248 RepID=A0A815KLG0_ADIRI|nr:unnamed protein product [Adineta ricciae]CAF1397321.1 unnamed protein product [Adineta ricciae]
MNINPIINDTEYQKCIINARRVRSIDKSFFCPNFYYVFHAELEINLNQYFSQSSRERWSLGFVDYDLLPPMFFRDVDLNTNEPFKLFWFPDDILKIVHNAKIKYCCRDCSHEWTTARGRAVFHAERPIRNKVNVLFTYLFTQKCRECLQEIQPCWYLDETTRVMRNICRILKDNFYSNRQFSSQDSSSDEDVELTLGEQRASRMTNFHERNLCSACLAGSCFASNWEHKCRR